MTMVEVLAGSKVPKPRQSCQKEISAVPPRCISAGAFPALIDSREVFAVDEKYPLLSGNQGSSTHHYTIDQNSELSGKHCPSNEDSARSSSPYLLPNITHKELSMNPLATSEPYTPGLLDSRHHTHLHMQDTSFATESDMKRTFSSDGGSYNDIGYGSLGGSDLTLTIGTTDTTGTYSALAYPTTKAEMYHAIDDVSFLSQTEETPSLSSSFDFIDTAQAEPALSHYLPFQTTNFIGNGAGKSSIQTQYDAQISGAFLPQSKLANSTTNAGWLAWSMGDEAESWRAAAHAPYWMADTSTWGNTRYYGDFWPTPETFSINTAPVNSPAIQTYDVHSLPPSSLTRTVNAGSSLSPPTSDFNPDYSVSGTASSEPRHEYYPTSSYAMHSSPKTAITKKELLGSQNEHRNQIRIPYGPGETKPVLQQQPSAAPGSIKPSMHYSDKRNAFLIKCKRRGLSYKDIKRFGGFKEAESTLRGRYRTLTKSKEQRVRKPKWQDTDIKLLCEAVTICTESLHLHIHPHSQPHPHDSAADAPENGSGTKNETGNPNQPPKVSWKKVAQYIWAHGGSYQFGNATCKKKWCEIHNVEMVPA